MNDERKKKDPETLNKTRSLITKCILGIMFCITAGIIFSTCGVSKSDMQECKSICGTRGVASVSQWACQCSWTSSRSDYVIPRTKSSK